MSMTDHTRSIPLDVRGDPVGDLCRRMTGEGLTGSLCVLDTSNGDRHIFTIPSIARRALLTVREDDKRGPHYAKWRPSPFAKKGDKQ